MKCVYILYLQKLIRLFGSNFRDLQYHQTEKYIHTGHLGLGLFSTYTSSAVHTQIRYSFFGGKFKRFQKVLEALFMDYVAFNQYSLLLKRPWAKKPKRPQIFCGYRHNQKPNWHLT